MTNRVYIEQHRHDDFSHPQQQRHRHQQQPPQRQQHGQDNGKIKLFSNAMKIILIPIDCNIIIFNRFIWRTTRWTACSARCDGGFRTRDVRCVSETSNQVVDDRNCLEEKPINITNCAQQRCPKWRTGDWGQVCIL